MAKSIIVYGRSDWGMAKYAERMRKHFGLKHVVVDFNGKVHKDNDYLYIAYCYLPGSTPSTMRVMSFEAVAQQINDAIPLTGWQSGPPPMVGEWNASRFGDLENRMWWHGQKWSASYHPEQSEDRRNRAARELNNGGISMYETLWRGLSEEPILVKP